ncbi:MAG: hypothetical protein V1859_06610 [archaeon]
MGKDITTRKSFEQLLVDCSQRGNYSIKDTSFNSHAHIISTGPTLVSPTNEQFEGLWKLFNKLYYDTEGNFIEREKRRNLLAYDEKDVHLSKDLESLVEEDIPELGHLNDTRDRQAKLDNYARVVQGFNNLLDYMEENGELYLAGNRPYKCNSKSLKNKIRLHLNHPLHWMWWHHVVYFTHPLYYQRKKVFDASKAKEVYHINALLNLLYSGADIVLDHNSLQFYNADIINGGILDEIYRETGVFIGATAGDQTISIDRHAGRNWRRTDLDQRIMECADVLHNGGIWHVHAGEMISKFPEEYGAVSRFLDKVNAYLTSEYGEDLNTTKGKILLAHCLSLGEDDIETIAKYKKNIAISLNPGSNLMYENGETECIPCNTIRKLREKGFDNFVLGGDSVATNKDGVRFISSAELLQKAFGNETVEAIVDQLMENSRAFFAGTHDYFKRKVPYVINKDNDYVVWDKSKGKNIYSLPPAMIVKDGTPVAVNQRLFSELDLDPLNYCVVYLKVDHPKGWEKRFVHKKAGLKKALDSLKGKNGKNSDEYIGEVLTVFPLRFADEREAAAQNIDLIINKILQELDSKDRADIAHVAVHGSSCSSHFNYVYSDVDVDVIFKKGRLPSKRYQQKLVQRLHNLSAFYDLGAKFYFDDCTNFDNGSFGLWHTKDTQRLVENIRPILTNYWFSNGRVVWSSEDSGSSTQYTGQKNTLPIRRKNIKAWIEFNLLKANKEYRNIRDMAKYYIRSVFGIALQYEQSYIDSLKEGHNYSIEELVWQLSKDNKLPFLDNKDRKLLVEARKIVLGTKRTSAMDYLDEMSYQKAERLLMQFKGRIGEMKNYLQKIP